MTRQQMIDVIVTNLLISPNKREQEDAVERMLRRGWKGYDNYSDEELKQEIDKFEPKRIEGLLLCSELLREDGLLTG